MGVRVLLALLAGTLFIASNGCTTTLPPSARTLPYAEKSTTYQPIIWPGAQRERLLGTGGGAIPLSWEELPPPFQPNPRSRNGMTGRIEEATYNVGIFPRRW